MGRGESMALLRADEGGPTMKDDSWQRAKEIFDEARCLAPEARASFVTTKCDGDDELRAEVEILLTSYKSDFLEDNALGAVDLLVEPGLTPGQIIGRYKIGELIGTGGMGQVYRAEDTELDRPVAFKVLHGDIAENDERVRRFIQEAKAASALNHPNILTIYEIGSFEGARFIVSEYIDGETLRDRMRNGLTSTESIDIMCQIATALQAAHAAGIVHRDIKPENIMLRHDGLVKVLDFGLAKLTEADDQPIDPTSPTLSRLQTSPGLIMGTVAYMSPEQARGQAVDSRTDLWSLGVVFHEMLTGESPFEGESVTDLVSSILKRDAVKVSNDKLPPELRPICTKSLAKDKEARYQSAHDLLQDLKGEKKRMEYAFQPTPYITVSSTDELKTQLIRRRPTLSAEYFVTGMKRHKYATLTAIALIVISAVSLSVYRYNGATPPDSGQSLAAINDSTTERDLQFSRLPISEQVRDSVISPDGKYAAYLAAKNIKLLDIATAVESDISAEDGWDLRFSPDSKFVYYVAGDFPFVIKRVSIQGGTPIKVADDPDNGPSFSPDGSTMVFTRQVRTVPRGKAIVLANPDGSNERTIATTEDTIGTSPIFSSDGKTIACTKGFRDKDGAFAKMVGFSAADGKQHTISEKRWNRIFGAVWLPNGNLVVTAREKVNEPSQLWSISPAGEAKAITSGLTSYQGLSATSSGDVLMTTLHSATNVDSADLWVVPGNDASKTKRLTRSGELQGRFTSTNDGRIVISSDVGGDRDIWIMNADGSGRRQLTRDPGGDAQPAVSPDGKYIAFTSDRVGGLQQIFRMDIDGGNVKQLTQGKQKALASFSPDGKWIYCVEIPSKTVLKLPVDGGEPVLVATAPDGWNLTGIEVNRADGRLVYGLRKNVSNVLQSKLVILPVKGEAKVIDVPATFSVERPRWAPDNRTIAILSRPAEKSSEIWSLSVDGKGKLKQITDFRTPAGYGGFSWTPDGKQLLVSRHTLTTTPVLIRNRGN